MGNYELRAVLKCGPLVALVIPRKLRAELARPKYGKMGISLVSLEMHRVEE